MRYEEFKARKHQILTEMERRGGGFVKALAAAWRKADGSNCERLFEAFPGVVDSYDERARESELRRLKFAATPGEVLLIGKILDRVEILIPPGQLATFDRQGISMDLIATHSNGCPMDFQKLFEAPTGDLFHDINGIQKHINRKTGKLGDFFFPRCAKPEPAGK